MEVSMLVKYILLNISMWQNFWGVYKKGFSRFCHFVYLELPTWFLNFLEIELDNPLNINLYNGWQDFWGGVYNGRFWDFCQENLQWIRLTLRIKWKRLCVKNKTRITLRCNIPLKSAVWRKISYLCTVFQSNLEDIHTESVFALSLQRNLTVSITTGQRTALILV